MAILDKEITEEEFNSFNIEKPKDNNMGWDGVTDWGGVSKRFSEIVEKNKVVLKKLINPTSPEKKLKEKIKKVLE